MYFLWSYTRFRVLHMVLGLIVIIVNVQKNLPLKIWFCRKSFSRIHHVGYHPNFLFFSSSNIPPNINPRFLNMSTNHNELTQLIFSFR